MNRTRVIASSAFAVLAALILALPASAGISWCRVDPIFTLDGKVGHVYLSAPEDALSLNNSSIDVVIAHPFKSATNLVYNESIAFGQGMSTNFMETTYLKKTNLGYEIEVRVYVPASSSSMPVLVEFAPGDGTVVTASAVGTANQWIVFRALLP